MAIKPILFNTDMVRAILTGRKTQTRRIIRTRHGGELEIHEDPDGVSRLCEKCGTVCYGLTPPCEPGDILWVRETWCDPEPENFMVPIFYKADMPLHWGAEDTVHGEAVDITAEEFKWRPSIHMPKEFARIFLRVKNVRLELLRNVFFTDGAAILEVQKEGVDIGETCRACIEHYGCPCCIDAYDDSECGELDDPRYVFSKLWDSTIKPADLHRHGWIANPWVWVIEFERCGKPEGW